METIGVARLGVRFLSDRYADHLPPFETHQFLDAGAPEPVQSQLEVSAHLMRGMGIRAEGERYTREASASTTSHPGMNDCAGLSRPEVLISTAMLLANRSGISGST